MRNTLLKKWIPLFILLGANASANDMTKTFSSDWSKVRSYFQTHLDSKKDSGNWTQRCNQEEKTQSAYQAGFSEYLNLDTVILAPGAVMAELKPACKSLRSPQTQKELKCCYAGSVASMNKMIDLMQSNPSELTPCINWFNKGVTDGEKYAKGENCDEQSYANKDAVEQNACYAIGIQRAFATLSSSKSYSFFHQFQSRELSDLRTAKKSEKETASGKPSQNAGPSDPDRNAPSGAQRAK